MTRLWSPIYFDLKRDILYFRNEFDFLAFGEPIWYDRYTCRAEEYHPTCGLQHVMVARSYPFLFLDETLYLVSSLQHLKSVVFERVPKDRQENASWELSARLKAQIQKLRMFGKDWNIEVDFLFKCEMEKMANGKARRDLTPEDSEREFITMTGIYEGEDDMWAHRMQNGHGGKPRLSWS
jgi:hypothetical protein